MPVAMVVRRHGVIIVDEEENILWEWRYRAPHLYGLDLTKEGNFVISSFSSIIEITPAGTKVWEYTYPKEFLGLHSVQATPVDTFLVASCMNDSVFEIDKREGLIWRWRTIDHYRPPIGYWERLTSLRMNPGDWEKFWNYQWTHLNHAWRLENGDTLIGFYYEPKAYLPIDAYDRETKALLIRVDQVGRVAWEWGRGTLEHTHYFIPHGDGYLVADSGGHRILKIKEDEVVWEMRFPYRDPKENQPLCLEPKPDGNLLVSFPFDGVVREITFDKEIIWEYQIPMQMRTGGKMVFCVKYLPSWEFSYTATEEKKILEVLRGWGYIE